MRPSVREKQPRQPLERRRRRDRKHTHLTLQPPLTPREENCACVQGLGFSTGHHGGGWEGTRRCCRRRPTAERSARHSTPGWAPASAGRYLQRGPVRTGGPLVSQTGARFSSAGFLRDSHRRPSLPGLELLFTTRCAPPGVREPGQTSGLVIG